MFSNALHQDRGYKKTRKHMGRDPEKCKPHVLATKCPVNSKWRLQKNESPGMPRWTWWNVQNWHEFICFLCSSIINKWVEKLLQLQKAIYLFGPHLSQSVFIWNNQAVRQTNNTFCTASICNMESLFRNHHHQHTWTAELEGTLWRWTAEPEIGRTELPISGSAVRVLNYLVWRTPWNPDICDSLASPKSSAFQWD